MKNLMRILALGTFLVAFNACQKDELIELPANEVSVQQESYELTIANANVSIVSSLKPFNDEEIAEMARFEELETSKFCENNNCERNIKFIANELQASANRDCSIKFAAGKCCKDGMTIYYIMMAEPEADICAITPLDDIIEKAIPVNDDVELTRGFKPVIIAAVCRGGNGYSLSAINANPNEKIFNPQRYQLEWVQEGYPIGRGQFLHGCYCGTGITLRVHDKVDKVSRTANIILPVCEQIDMHPEYSHS